MNHPKAIDSLPRLTPDESFGQFIFGASMMATAALLIFGWGVSAFAETGMDLRRISGVGAWWWVCAGTWALVMVFGAHNSNSIGRGLAWALYIPASTFFVLRWSAQGGNPQAWWYWLALVSVVLAAHAAMRLWNRKDSSGAEWLYGVEIAGAGGSIIAVLILLTWGGGTTLLHAPTKGSPNLWYAVGSGMELELAIWWAVSTFCALMGAGWGFFKFYVPAVAIVAAFYALRSPAPMQVVYWLPIAASVGVWPLVARGWYQYPERTKTRQQASGASAESDFELDAEKMQAQAARKSKKKRSPCFDDIHGMKDVKRRLLDAYQEIDGAEKAGKQARNGVLLYGPPGNGKTVFARALANEVHLPLVTMTGGQVTSQWVGETTVNVRNAFKRARESAPCLFFIDEIDSILRDRESRALQNNDEARTLVNTMLTEIVGLRSHKVVLMAATNNIDVLDAAGIREGRFDFKIEIPPPDEEARIGLLRQGLAQHVRGIKMPEDELLAAARRWKGFSVKRILAITEELPRYLAENPRKAIGLHDLMACLRRVQGRAGAVPENAKSLDELILSDQARLQLRSIARRMRDIHQIEAMGGSVPDGVLFYGPPGTGKTEAVRTLAKESGWALLATTGHDLIADAGALDKLYAQASDLRPSIVFIDEGDDILMDRSYSQARMVTNKLLTLMDGVHGKTPDVLFVTATNNPDALDGAVLRGGRFTEKIEFLPPDAASLRTYIDGWIARKKVRLADGAAGVAASLDGCSIANANAVLQSALNLAIGDASGQGQIVIEQRHLSIAVRSILGAR